MMLPLKSTVSILALALAFAPQAVFAMDLPVEGSPSHSIAVLKDESLESHLNGKVLGSAVNDLNEGKKGVCFLPINFSTSEKNFLEKLEVKIPANIPFGKGLDSGGTIFFTEEEKSSQQSVYNRAKHDLQSFFTDTTNATELENPNAMTRGPEFLANVLLEYAEKLLDKVNAAQPHQEKNNCVNFSLKAFQPNDAFLNFHRWHYDGDVRHGAADLNFAGAFIGAPTVFAKTADDNRDILPMVKRISQNTRMNPSPIEEMMDRLVVMRDSHQQNTIEYKNIDKEIKAVQQLDMSNDSNKQEIFRRLQVRMNLHALEKENLISGIVTPKPHEVAVFTMNGINPALHSEPNITVPRLFFGLRVYLDIKEDEYSTFSRDLPDPRTF